MALSLSQGHDKEYHAGDPLVAPWFRFAWHSRWLAICLVMFWLHFFGTSTPTTDRILRASLAIVACVNAALFPLLRRDAHVAGLAPVIVADTLLTACFIRLLGPNSQTAFLVLLYLMPIMVSAAAYGVRGAFAGYVLAFVSTLPTIGVPELDTESRPAWVGGMLLLAFATGLIGQWAGYERRHAGVALALRQLASTLPQVDDQQQMMNVVAHSATNLVAADSVFLLFPDEDERSMLIMSETRREVQPSVTEGLVRRVLDTGQPSLATGGDFDLPVLVSSGRPRSVLAVPMRLAGRTIGVIMAVSRRDRAFAKEHVEQLEMLGAHAGVFFEHQRAHRKLQSDRKTLDSILHSIGSGVLVTNERGEIALLNHGAEFLLRTTEADAHMRPLSSLEADSLIIEVLERVQRSGRPATEELTLATPANVITRVDCAPVHDAEGRVIGHVAVFNDITELRRLDHLKSEFVSSVSHELRTPLTSIKAFTATLLRAEFDRETQREFLGVVNDQCDKLTRLINDLLSISKIESGAPLDLRWARVDARKLVERVARVQQASTSQHTIDVEAGAEELIMDADEDKLERVVANLISNAVKYSPDGGAIRVALKAEGDEVLLSVRDDGIGIPAERQQAVFEKFYQIDGGHTRRVGGSGLGLFLVKHLVEAHGGSIRVTSEVGAGSEFTCRFPRYRTKVLAGGAEREMRSVAG